MSQHRVSPPRVFPEATHAPRPPAEAAGAADAFRQARFVLGAELDLVLRGLEVEGQMARAAAAAKFRNQVVASVLATWSRSWLCRLQALHAVEWGNYAAALPLVRSAVDYQAVQLLLLRTGADEWVAWLDEGGVGAAPEQHATQFRLHPYRAAEVLAAHELLGPVYRASMDLSMPHFGATLVVAGGDSNAERIAVTFGDRDYHHGFAELVLGWLLDCGVAQVEAVRNAAGALPVPDEAAAVRFGRDAKAAVARKDRCRVIYVDAAGEQRILIENWRRQASAAPKRLLL
ncbi:MAG: hypothetical protein Kow0010_00160 [Dehalococcoidia bacterium]